MKKIILIALVFFLFPGCKKYPDDPFISFQSPRRRLGGTWDLQKVTINGTDSTAQFFANAYCGCSINFDESGGESAYIGKCISNSNTSCGSKFAFNNDRNIGMKGTLIYPQISEYIVYEILRLYKGQLKLKAVHPDNEKEYLFEYKKKQ